MTIQEIIAPIIWIESNKFNSTQLTFEEISNKNPGKYPGRLLWMWKDNFINGIERSKRQFLKDYYNLLVDLEIEGADSKRISSEESALIEKFKKKLEKDRKRMEVFFKRDFHQYSQIDTDQRSFKKNKSLKFKDLQRFLQCLKIKNRPQT